ncbi:TIGR03986 family CRISPR-associated RAMP protein [Paenibacillus spiritus]|nr:TIGR03986 family CRISPR-associated RAMP protein [Paenibacillus spiritus]
MNSGHDKKKSAIEITLPYDFIPLPGNGGSAEYYYPYSRYKGTSAPPRHDLARKEQFSGYLSYRINPHSPLALELREIRDNAGKATYWLSGSQIRGKLRSNVELLSASYPEFVDDSEMLYRKINSGDRYKELLGIKGELKLEQVVHAGYLHRDEDGSYYVTPAVSIGEYNFASIKELEIVQMQNGSMNDEELLFDWKATTSKGTKIMDQMTEYASKIKKLDEWITHEKRQRNFKEHGLADKVQKVFMDFSFTKISGKVSGRKTDNDMYEINNLEEDLRRRLKQLKGELKEYSYEDLFEKMVERWALKLQMHLIYLDKNKPLDKTNKAGFKKTNNTPYSKAVRYRLEGNKVTWVGHPSSPEKGTERGTLFNSTNASSKRNHYLIGIEREDAIKIKVPDNTIQSYKRAFERIRVGKTKKPPFYDLFTPGKIEEPIVVFYQTISTEDGDETVSAIGRTPYFRIPYDHQIRELLGPKNQNKVDYASALFGYTSSNRKLKSGEETEIDSYKSRLRFTPVRLYGEIPPNDIKSFLLATPQASAGAMYLKPNRRRRASTYEEKFNEPSPQLRGSKYYHVLDKPFEYSSNKKRAEDSDNMISQRYVYDPAKSPFYFEGKIHFTNVTEAELGLLLLAMDISQLPSIGQYSPGGNSFYELIGGAKPYGYGKVMFTVGAIELERKETDFDSLINNPYETNKATPSTFVNAFLNGMGGDTWLKRIHMDQYVQSKMEKDFKNLSQSRGNTPHINWSNMDEMRKKVDNKTSGGGYPDSWILKS